MSKPDWKVIKEAYQDGGLTYRELAGMFGVTEKAIEMRAYRQGWRAEAKEIVEQVKERTIERAVAKRQPQVEFALQVADEWLRELNSLMVAVCPNKTLKALIAKIQAKSKPTLRDLRDLTASMEAISRIMERMNDIYRKGKGLDKPELPKELGAMIPLGGLALQEEMLRKIQAIGALVEKGAIKTIDLPTGEEMAKVRIIRRQ